VWSFSLYKEKDGATVYLTADAAAYRRWREAERASA
jgi:hypothetical protein